MFLCIFIVIGVLPADQILQALDNVHKLLRFLDHLHPGFSHGEEGAGKVKESIK